MLYMLYIYDIYVWKDFLNNITNLYRYPISKQQLFGINSLDFTPINGRKTTGNWVYVTFTNGVITLLIAAKGPPCRKLQGICHLGTYCLRLLVVDFSLAPPFFFCVVETCVANCPRLNWLRMASFDWLLLTFDWQCEERLFDDPVWHHGHHAC